MMSTLSKTPVICFGQQPCGFFPRRFLFSKIQTARKLQKSIGGEVVFFYHDSDHDPRETKTILHNLKTQDTKAFNFEYKSKIQHKFSPLYAKSVDPDWHSKTAIILYQFVDRRWVDVFKNNQARDVSSFCLEMYRQMGLLEGIRVVRSGDTAFRRAACDISKSFVDVPYEGEIVRARFSDGKLALHKGGDAYIHLPMVDFTKEQVSPARDSRLLWMQSVIHCTHYVSGAGEQAYLNKEEAPEITFVERDPIDRSEEAYADNPI
jgi:hypothetical protein